jgi:hypothetical protein
MLCTFTTRGGKSLIIRSDDIRALIDEPEGTTTLTFVVGEVVTTYEVTGTAAENRDRIQQEELDLIERVNQHHLRAQQQAQQLQQMAAQLAAQPPKVARGKQATK